jgi:hypothetical protein
MGSPVGISQKQSARNLGSSVFRPTARTWEDFDYSSPDSFAHNDFIIFNTVREADL